MRSPPLLANTALSRGPAEWDRGSDRGSSVVEFAMVIVLLMVLFLSLVQFCLWAYTRTLLTSAAAETARYAGLRGSSHGDTTARVADILGTGVTGSTRETLRCTASSDGVLIEVQCTMTAPGIVGLLDGVMPGLEVTGHSAVEDQP